MVTQRMKLALIGLGRLGVIRARILAYQQPRIELVAACDTKPGASEFMVNLPPNVQFFADPEDCMKNSGADAVLISTATATHAPLICMALNLNLHVMCEKPISIDIATCDLVLAKAAEKPHLKFLLPFSRRYDDSYRAVKKMVEAGSLGRIHAVEATCVDQQDPQGFFVAFSPLSGGIFVDCGIHVIDIGRYFLKGTLDLKAKRVVAMGQQAVYGDLAKYGDADNGWGLVEFQDGRVLTIYLGRTLTNGFEASTRVMGTKAHTVINGNSTLNRVEVRDSHGVRTATCPDAFTLYDKTFLNDLSEFAHAVLDNAPLSCLPEDAYEASKIAFALQHSFRAGEPVYFDEEGRAIIETAKLNGTKLNEPTTGKLNRHVNGDANEYVSGFVNGHRS